MSQFKEKHSSYHFNSEILWLSGPSNIATFFPPFFKGEYSLLEYPILINTILQITK